MRWLLLAFLMLVDPLAHATQSTPHGKAAGQLWLSAFQLLGIGVLYLKAIHDDVPHIACSSKEMSPPVADSAVKRVYVSKNGESVIAKYRGQRRVYYPIDSVWGFTKRSLAWYRVYDHHVYKIRNRDTLSVYHAITRHRLYWEVEYCFSKGLDGPMQPFTPYEIQVAYGANIRFANSFSGSKWLRHPGHVDEYWQQLVDISEKTFY